MHTHWAMLQLVHRLHVSFQAPIPPFARKTANIAYQPRSLFFGRLGRLRVRTEIWVHLPFPFTVQSLVFRDPFPVKKLEFISRLAALKIFAFKHDT